MTDTTGGRETLADTGVLTSMITRSIAAAAAITVKDSAEAIFRPIASMTAMGDGNRLIAFRKP